MVSEVEGLLNLTANIEKLRDEALGKMGKYVMDDVKDRMNNQKQINDSSYVPLKPNTIKQKERKGYQEPSKRLIATGRLRDGITMTVDKQAGKVTLLPALDRAEIAIYMLNGTSRGIPKTNFFSISEEMNVRIEEIKDSLSELIIKELTSK